MEELHVNKEDQQNRVILQQKIIHLKAELSKYMSKVKDYQDNYHYSQLETLKNENSILSEKIKELERYRIIEKEEFSNIIAEMKEKISELTEKEKNYITSIITLKEQYQEISNILEEFKKREFIIIEELKDYEKNELLLQGQLAYKDNLLNQLKKENEQLSNKNNELLEILTNTETNQIELKKHIEVLDIKYNEKITDFKKLEDELNNTLEKNRLLEEEIQKIIKESQQYKDQIKCLQSEIYTWEKKFEESEATLSNIKSENENLYLDKKLLYEELESLKYVEKELESKIMTLKHEIISYPNDAKSSNSNYINALENDIKNITHNYDGLIMKINDNNNIINICLQQINQLEEQIDALTEVIAKLKEPLAESLGS